MYTERTTAAAAAARDGTARDMTARSDAACREMDGSLPGGCGNMVFPYIAMQRENAQRSSVGQIGQSSVISPRL